MSMHDVLANVPVWGLLVALATLAASVIGAIWAAGTWLSKQFSGGLDERFEAIEAARTEAQKHWLMRFAPIERHVETEPQRWDDLEDRMHQMHQELIGRDVRIVRIEEEVRHLPNRNEFARLHERIDDLAQAVHMAGGKLEELSAIRAMMNRINDYLLEH